jgi:serine/threonine protein kinase/tetratricopeptide (TPR) repeat protein
MVGQAVSHYRILEPLGAGGMGVVYKAEDTRLLRPVALKFLPPALVQDAAAKDRLLREAQAASALDHPNICTIYGFEETSDGALFLIMAFYDGETVKQRLGRGPMPVADAVDLAIQAAVGLGAAHAHGIVHRDVKPANLMIAKDGTLKILDFGLACVPEATSLTGAGVALGTISYMAPEQARGEAVDARADLWSLGVVLYEMIAGRSPFAADSAPAVLNRILHTAPEPLHAMRSDTPMGLSRVIRRALSKAPEGRYESSAELIEDLRHLRRQLESGTMARAVDRRVPSIAVLAFSDMSPERDQEYLCEGIAEELITALVAVEGLRVAARTSSFQFKGQASDIRRIGEQLDVSTVLEGSVRKSGNRLRITAQLVSTSDGYHLWSGRFDRTMDDVFSLQEEIAREVVAALRLRLATESSTPLVRRHTDDLEAYDLYLQARYYWTRRYAGFLPKARERYEQAIARDPRYAPAHAGLADVHSVLGLYGVLPPRVAFAAAGASAQRALELDPALPDAYQAAAFVRWFFDWNTVEAERAFRRALTLNPQSGIVRAQLAVFLATQHRAAEGVAEAERARVLEPLSLLVGYYNGLVFFYAHEYQRGLEECRRVLDLDPQFALSHWVRGKTLLQVGQPDEAVAAASRGVDLSNRAPFHLSLLGQAHAARADRAAAGAVVDELLAKGLQTYVSPLHVADICLALGEDDRAFEYLTKALADRTGFLGALEVDESYDRVRSDPRFVHVVEEVRRSALEPGSYLRSGSSSSLVIGNAAPGVSGQE